MPEHRKRRTMLNIMSIVLLVVLFVQIPAFSVSVAAAGESGESVAEEYERYQERFRKIEKIEDLEENGFRLMEDQIARAERVYPVVRADVHLSVDDVYHFPERMALAAKNIARGKMKMIKRPQRCDFNRGRFRQLRG